MAVFARSWSLFRSALAVLGAEKAFLLYPLLAGLGILIFSALILGGTLERLHGGDPSFADGLALARQRAGVILGYSGIAATVGLLLSMLRGRDQQPGIGLLLSSLGGFAWSVATFLVIPVLAAKGIGAIAAIKESVTLLKRTWGEQLSLNVGLGVIIGLPMLLLFAATFGAAFWAASTQQPALIIGAIATGVTLIALLSLISATLNAIIRGAIYVYAEEGEVPGQFDDTLVRQALKSRKR
ncbi:hypothetical protein Thiowin_02544 [Thiorhodovibrio winogradskyi]|uniref:Glycerophosphoryl diester phosphodiesterase membrane domain-containing protein n=1 Tax=Thiorhodovibrio winogradskyi TaxID=77007 RepID=A0ABZ0SB42_9GAMM|nr:DUF6159 family protein [Thiorhodovibrio winogradskyi]